VRRVPCESHRGSLRSHGASHGCFLPALRSSEAQGSSTPSRTCSRERACRESKTDSCRYWASPGRSPSLGRLRSTPTTSRPGTVSRLRERLRSHVRKARRQRRAVPGAVVRHEPFDPVRVRRRAAVAVSRRRSAAASKNVGAGTRFLMDDAERIARAAFRPRR